MMRRAAPCPTERVISIEAAATSLGTTAAGIRILILESRLEGRTVGGRLRVTVNSMRRAK